MLVKRMFVGDEQNELVSVLYGRMKKKCSAATLPIDSPAEGAGKHHDGLRLKHRGIDHYDDLRCKYFNTSTARPAKDGAHVKI